MSKRYPYSYYDFLTKDFLYNELIIKNKKIHELAKEYNISTTCIQKRISKFHIQDISIERLINRQFNNFTILEKTEEQDKHGNYYYICECVCGKKEKNIAVNITGNHRTSCGCIKFEKERNWNWKGYGEISGNIYTSFRKSAEKRKIPFEVSIEYLWKLFLQQERRCALSNLEIYIYGPKTKKGKITRTASIDRIDSTKGYSEGNVQWVHKDINWMKQDYDEPTFVDYCVRVAKYKGKI